MNIRSKELRGRTSNVETTVPSLEKWESTIAANLCVVAEDEEGIKG
ncbi:phosphinothricin N-acetyltransferase domain protein [Anoxybacillus sp. B7M1]|jgi:hypothetical protein|nr:MULTISPECIES: hypothetical protein [unclassified Anoxybacillus]ANB56147.1 phosphinothricin N-acetyltransferase domain protein [Anoxybacillus sp. B2M1]ANB65148.1 phosphinothricin N-acetyltransferase domain protein [Anoxybacillus sp. B7M1]